MSLALVWSRLEGRWHVAGRLGMAMSRDKAGDAGAAGVYELGARVVGAGEGGMLIGHGSPSVHVGWNLGCA